MGLDINAVRFLIAAHQRGVRHRDVLMLGRQDLNVYPAAMVKELRKHGLPADEFLSNDPAKVRYAEPVFRALGATSVQSMDASSFEGAEHVHDLNQPIGAELKEKFDLVYDGGTLEHIFNFPQALKNCMEMVRVGGHVMMHTITNNWCGHGFYQFSPELFFQAFSAPNGFVVERMVAHIVGPYGRWYEVSDPERIRQRVEVVNTLPLHLWVEARRVAVNPVFEAAPQQSDYTPRWDPATKPEVVYQPDRSALSRVVPGLARVFNVAKNGLTLLHRQSLRNRARFTVIQKP